MPKNNTFTRIIQMLTSGAEGLDIVTNMGEAAMKRHETRLRVRYAETDQMGVVYYANYLVWMEVGRVELVRALGFAYKELEQTEGLYLSVIDAQCRYIFPARYDQEVIVETEVVKATSRTVEFGYRIRSAEAQRLLAEGLTRHLWLNKEWRPARLPELYRAALGVISRAD